MGHLREPGIGAQSADYFAMVNPTIYRVWLEPRIAAGTMNEKVPQQPVDKHTIPVVGPQLPQYV